jgi:hypothetical protein
VVVMVRDGWVSRQLVRMMAGVLHRIVRSVSVHCITGRGGWGAGLSAGRTEYGQMSAWPRRLVEVRGEFVGSDARGLLRIVHCIGRVSVGERTQSTV